MEYLIALIGPFFLLLVENFLPYPYLVEEIFKFFLAKSSTSIKMSFALGLLFSLSEAFFYFLNPIYTLNPSLYTLRLLLVTILHVTTILIMQYFISKKRLWPLGLLLSILIHYLFNLFGGLWSKANTKPLLFF